MQTRERHVSRPEAAAVARAAALEGTAARDRAEIARLTQDLAEMREDRDRWRTQAERLAGAVEQMKAPTAVDRVVVAPAEHDSANLLYGVPAIAKFLRLRERQVRHRIDAGTIPTFRLDGTICARESTLNAWLAKREAAAASTTTTTERSA